MTLLTVVQDVCAAVGVVQPTSVFSGISSNRTMQEMVSLANEMAQRIAYDTRDWTKLKQMKSFSGDGVTTAFNLPQDYKRMLKTSNVWRSTSGLQPMRFIPDTDQWLQRRLMNMADAWGEWTMQGGQMLIWPAMAIGVTATFAYLHKNCIVPAAGGGVSDTFVADGDDFALDGRLFKLGMIWQWKANKGSPYAEDLGTYGDTLASVQGADSPAPIIVGRKPISLAVKVAYPWPVPTP